MKIFISGPMRGIENDNRPMFDACEALLKKKGFDVFNPAWIRAGSEWSREDLLVIDLTALSRCDAICFLPGYENAGGCMLESKFAKLDHKPVYYFQPDWDRYHNDVIIEGSRNDYDED